jgi:succinyl-diaminopimelate desuccinylase
MMKQLLLDLISLQSTKENNELSKQGLELIAKYIAAQVEVQYEWYTKNDKHALVIHNGLKGEKRFDVILSGHVDVVPGPAAAFVAAEGNGKIWGRGASDMKGVDVAMVGAFIEAVKSNSEKKIALMLTSDEEVGGFDGVDYLVNEVGYYAEFVFLPDSGRGDWSICTDEKGVVWLKLTAKGKSAHGSRPWLGINAADNLLNAYAKIKTGFEARFGKPNGEEEYLPTLNLGVIAAGQTPNVIPEDAFARLDIRFPASFDKNELVNFVTELAAEQNVTVEEELYGPPNSTPGAHPEIARWVELVSKAGITPEFYKSCGASDARFFSAKGMPVLMTKPVCSEIHIDEEWIEWGSLEQFTRNLTEWLRSS